MLINTLRRVAITLLLVFAVQALAGQPIALEITGQRKLANNTILVDFKLVWPDTLPGAWTPSGAQAAVTGNEADVTEASTFTPASSVADEEAVQELLQSKPRWHIFLEGSDGRYKSLYLDTLYREPQLTFTDTFLQPGNYEYLMRGTPVYSPTDKPRRERRSFRITGNNDPPTGNGPVAKAVTSQPTNFPADDDSTRIFIETSLFAAAPGDTVTIALNIRNLNESPLEGHQVELVVPDSLEVLRESVRNAAGFDLTVTGKYTFGQQSHVHLARLWRWSVPKLEPGESRTFFVDAVLDKNLSRGNLNLAFGLSPQADTSPNPYSWPGLGSPDSQGGKSIKAGETNQADFSTSIQVNRSRDPNHLVILPDVLYPGQEPRKLNMEAHFQNIGDAPVMSLKIDYFQPDPLLENASYSIKKQLFYGGTTLPNSPKFVTNPNWNLSKSVIFTGERAGAGWLPGLGMLTNPANARYSMGHIQFDFMTKTGHVFRTGESILGKIEINMDGDKLSSATEVPVVDPPTYRLPPRFGGKAGINSYPAGDGLTPFHAGLFALFSLDRAKAAASITTYRSSLRYSELPRIYLQLELLYNQLTESVATMGVTREFTSIDLPVQLRWVPQRVGSINLRRAVGFSAGLTPAYVLSTTTSSGPEPTEDSGFELYGHLDLSTGNFVDDRFIAFGLRYNHLLTKGVLKDDWNGYGQIYLQISL